MFFGAHADDMEIRAAGTMRKLLESGYRAISVMMTNNLCGIAPKGPIETRDIRHAEAREAAAILGVELLFLDFKELCYDEGPRRVYFGTDDYDIKSLPGREPLIAAPYLRHCVDDVARLLDEVAPDIVITHSIANVNPEHIAAAHLTQKAFRGARAPRELWFCCRVQSPGDVMFLSPDVLIDITPWYPLKVASLRAHSSQNVALDRVRNTDEYWGRVAGAEVAEAFRTVIRRV
jgi:LmbE family N-acetylglucosaminyl deacetylase